MSVENFERNCVTFQQENNHESDQPVIIEQDPNPNIVVLEDSEDVDMKAPDLPGPKERDRSNLPNIPAPAASVSSVASSSVITKCIHLYL